MFLVGSISIVSREINSICKHVSVYHSLDTSHQDSEGRLSLTRGNAFLSKGQKKMHPKHLWKQYLVQPSITNFSKSIELVAQDLHKTSCSMMKVKQCWARAKIVLICGGFIF